MNTDNNKISVRQSTIMTVMYFFCSSVVTMPVFVINTAGNAGCVASLLCAIIIILPLLLMCFLLKNDSSASLYDLCTEKTGKLFADIIYMFYVLKTIVFSTLLLKLFTFTLSVFLLPRTPTFLTALAMLALCVYMASKGIEARGRMSEILVFLIGIPFIIVFTAACFSIKIENITGIFEVKAAEIIKSAFLTAFSFISFDFILFHIFYCSQRKHCVKRMFFSSICTVIFISVIIFITTACFGTFIMSKQYAPIPQIMNVIKLPASFMERHDLLNMFFWILMLFWFLSTSLFYGCVSLKSVLKKPPHTVCIITLSVFIYAFTFINTDISEIYAYMGIVNIISNIFFFVCALILLGRRKK